MTEFRDKIPAAHAPFCPSFEHYADAIAGLPERDKFLKTDLLVGQFRVFKSESLEIYYAPFDFLNGEAKVAIVGITPGWTQMEIAFRQAWTVLRNGGSATEGKSASQFCRGDEKQSGEDAG